MPPARNAKSVKVRQVRVKKMEDTSSNVQLTVLVPGSVYERLEKLAANERQDIAHVAGRLLEERLDSRNTFNQRMTALSDKYRQRLAREGKLEQAPDEVLEELRVLREQIANELYP